MNIRIALTIIICLCFMSACSVSRSIEVGNPLETEAPEPNSSYTNHAFGVAMTVRSDFQIAEEEASFVRFEDDATSFVQCTFAWGNCPASVAAAIDETDYIHQYLSALSMYDDRAVCITVEGVIRPGISADDDRPIVAIDTDHTPGDPNTDTTEPGPQAGDGAKETPSCTDATCAEAPATVPGDGVSSRTPPTPVDADEASAEEEEDAPACTDETCAEAPSTGLGGSIGGLMP